MYVFNEGETKYSKAQIYQGIREYILANTGMYVQKEEKIDELPNLLRHACAGVGVVGLAAYYFTIPETTVQVPFYFCNACGKLYLPKEF